MGRWKRLVCFELFESVVLALQHLGGGGGTREHLLLLVAARGWPSSPEQRR